MAIVFGISLLLATMGLVMGVPFVYYLKRDLKYDATNGQPEDVRLISWYE